MSAAKGHSVVPNKHHLPSLVNPQRAGRLTNHLQYLENDVMEELWNHEFSGPFLFPVDPVSLPAYYEFIKNPMDLSTIRKRLRNRYYHHGMECVQDVLSIFINCYTFHKPTDDIILKAKTLQAIFLNKINTMPKLEWDIESEPTRQRQNPTEISKLTSHKPFHRRKLAFTPNENNKVLMWDDDHRPRDSVASRASTVSSGMSLRENSRILFCKPHQQTHENSTPLKKMRTELQQEIAFQNCGKLMELKKHQEEKTHLILRCGEEVSRPPDKHTAAERERLKKEAQTRRRMEADLNRFDLTLQSNLMAEFEEKFL